MRTRARKFLTALTFLGAFAACATPVTAPESPWEAEELRRVAAELEAHHIHVLPSSSWTREDLDGVAASVEWLPDFILPGPDDPLTIARDDRHCLLGKGRYTDACPTFADGGALILYDLVLHPGEPRYQVYALSETDQVRLLRARAVAHALTARQDLLHGLSDTPAWRSISGWDRSGRHARNRDTSGFVRVLGQRSVQKDLLTSAEAFLIRPEDLVDGANDLDPDLTFSCREVTRSEILDQLFSEIDPDWKTGSLRENHSPLPCPAFDAWAQLDSLTSVEILFATETIGRPEALFGHLLLQLRYDSPDTPRVQTYEFRVAADSDVDVISYTVEAVTGRFLATLTSTAGNDLNGASRGRSYRRFQLHLSPEEKRRLLHRIREVEGGYAYAYYFTTRNSASLLLELLDPVLEGPDLPRRLFSHPAEVLEILGRRHASTSANTPLLRATPHTDHDLHGSGDTDPDLFRRSLRPSTTHRLRVGLQSPLVTDTFAPTLSVHGAVIEDLLGERRLFGPSAEIETLLLALRLRGSFDLDPAALDAELTALRYVYLPGRLGWGIDLGVRARVHELPVSGRAFLGPFVSVLRSTTGVNHLALGLGPALTSEITPEMQHVTAGLQGELLASVHLGGSLGHRITLRGRYLEARHLPSLQPYRHLQARSGLEFFLPLGRPGRLGALVGPYAEVELFTYEHLDPTVDDLRLWAGFSLEPLRQPTGTNDP